MVTEKEIESFIKECQDPKNENSYIYLRGQFEILLDEVRRIESERWEDRVVEAEDKYDDLYWRFQDLKYNRDRTYPED